MSRIGKQPVAVPAGVKIGVAGQTISIEGPLGKLSQELRPEVTAQFDEAQKQVVLKRKDDTRQARALHGLYRALVANMVEGVTKGFEKKLEITGVGYRAAMQGKNLQLALGYSHDVVYAIPEGITIVVPKPTEITITGNDSQRVGQVAAEIRAYRPPEPYKGKGVKYANEFIFRKEGKKK
jgi:large subunit ribosomal protein L6